MSSSIFEPIAIKNGMSKAIHEAFSNPDKTLKLWETKYKIDVLERIPPPELAYTLFNTETEKNDILGTLGNFSVIIGKAKAGKSFYINTILSAVVSNALILERIKGHLPQDKNVVIYIDTEQGKYHVQKATKRICTQTEIDNPKNLHVYFLRSLTPAERLDFIEHIIYITENLGFLVIDGIKDLVTSINDEEQATNIASKLLKWSEDLNIHITTVLHQNKSDTNARGHIGTELINKAETVLEVAKSEADKSITIVTPQQCRNLEPQIFAFEINEFGIPIVAENFELRTETKNNRFNAANLEGYKKFKLLNEVFSNGDSFGYKQLEIQIKLASKNQLGKELGTNAVTSFITDCKNNNWLLQKKAKAPYTLGEFQENQI